MSKYKRHFISSKTIFGHHWHKTKLCPANRNSNPITKQGEDKKLVEQSLKYCLENEVLIASKEQKLRGYIGKSYLLNKD